MSQKLSSKQIKEQRKENIQDFSCGKFTLGWRKIPEINEPISLNPFFYIRLNEIKAVEYLWCIEEDEMDGCFFYTYKDHKYFSYLRARDLLDLLNEDAGIISIEKKNDRT